MNRLGVDISSEVGIDISTAVGMRICDLPPGPKPGPKLPKKKRPQIP